MEKVLDYAKVYKNVLHKKVCSKLLNDSADYHYEDHRFVNSEGKNPVKLSGSKELEIAYTKTNDHKFVNTLILKTANEYLDTVSNVKKAVNYSTPIRFNKYTVGKQMAEHVDHIHSIFDGTAKGIPILSVLMLLNDDFEGGEFILKNKKIDLGAGDMLIFPSNFMFPHKVEEVTKGERHSIVSWCW